MLKIHFTFRRILCLWEKLSHIAYDHTGDRKLFSSWFPFVFHALAQKCQEMQETDSFQWLSSSSVIANSCTGPSFCQKPSRILSDKIVRKFLRYSFHSLDFHSIVSMPASNFSKQCQAISSNSYSFNFPILFLGVSHGKYVLFSKRTWLNYIFLIYPHYPSCPISFSGRKKSEGHFIFQTPSTLIYCFRLRLVTKLFFCEVMEFGLELWASKVHVFR